MNVKIKSMSLLNFKGLCSITINFGDKFTDIYGANGTGKTTIVDAFNWLLFGKNSIGKSDFEIKTLDSLNKPIHKLEHEVQAVLDANGQEINLKRTFREKWTKKRGEEVAVFTGHETEFYWNDVPLKESEFKSKIDGILNEGMFKLLSNTNQFAMLPWKDQRECLISLAGDVSNDQIIDSIATAENDFGAIISILNQGKSLVEFKKEIAAKKKKIKDEIELLPSRISEAQRSLPEPKDYEAIKKQIEVKEASIAEINKQIADVSELQKKANEEALSTQNQVYEKKSQLSKIEFEIRTEVESFVNNDRSKVDDKQRKINVLKSEISAIEKSIEIHDNSIQTAQSNKEADEKRVDEIRAEWNTVNSKVFTFDESECKCPTCKQALPESDLLSQRTALESNFNKDKADQLSRLVSLGTQKKNEIENHDLNIKNHQSSIEGYEKSIADKKAELLAVENELNFLKTQTNVQIDVATEVAKKLEASMEYTELNKQINELELKIANRSTDATSNDLELSKTPIQDEINQLYSQLGLQKQEETIKSRITELETSLKNQSQELANLERTEFDIEKFTKAKMDIIEGKVNSMFSFVKFKLFETQINGGEAETCKVLINGVPFSDANTASKINAGLDIINTLSNAYQLSVPVFIDNRESISEIIPTSGQIVNLFVSPSHTTLTIK